MESEPADRATNAAPDQAIRLRFDEILDDQQLRDLPRLIRVNPSEPVFEHILDDDTVILQPEAPLLDGITYSVTLMPGIRDRGGNASTQPRTILFSVGGTTPITLSLVRATILRDSTPVPLAFYRAENEELDFDYTMVADSAGQVTMEGLAYGTYVATAWEERVRPEGWQQDEEAGARDSFTLGAGNRGHEAIYRIAVRDTTPPLVRRVETPGSATVSIVFDDTLAADVPSPEAVRLWQAAPGVAGRDVALDSLPLGDVRGRRLAVGTPRRVGHSVVELDLPLPMESGEVYRVEIVGLANRTGTRTEEGAGLTFRAGFEGARVFRAEPIEVPPEPVPETPGAGP